MKKIYIMSIAISTLLFSQTFQEYQQAQLSEFTQYKKSIDDEFASLLKKQWSAFKSFKQKPLYQKPKPKKLPVVKKEIIIPKQEIKKSPIVTLKPKDEKKPIVVKKPIDKPKITIDKNIKKISFKFYGQDVVVDYHKSIDFDLSRIDNKSISNAWAKLGKSKSNQLIKQINYYIDKLNLNDWAKYLLVYDLGENIYHNKNKTNIFTWFVLSKLGYDIKVGYSSNSIYLLCAINHNLYQVSFFTIKNQKYYILTPDGKAGNIGAVYTYNGNYPEAIKKMSFEIKQPIKFNNNIKQKRLSFDFQGKHYIINAQYSNDLVKFYSTFPQCDYKIYFHSKDSPQISQSILTELRKYLKGKSELEAVNFLLRFTQKSFQYKTDGDQFSYEKVMFPDETVFYPYSDCEDRSIMFATLVKNLLGLKVVGLKFSDHLATAVKFNSYIDGHSIKYQGQRYIVSDPTYINANVGMTTPKYKNASFKVVQ